MKKLDGRTISIGEILSLDWFFRIPEYQRPFSWETDNFEDLIDDLTSADPNTEYFLGTVVLHNRGDEGYRDVVDGQQRLTSILILLACLRDRVENAQFKSGLQKKIKQEEDVVDGIPERDRLEVKDSEVFKKLVVTQNGTIDAKSKSGLPEPEWRYHEAVSVFAEKLDQYQQSDLEKLIQFIGQRCVLIYLSTDTFDDAFRLFTIVNDRGKQLRRIDVLKAINISPDVISSEVKRHRIAKQWEDVEKNLGESAFESIFHLVRLILLKDKPQADVLKEFEDRIFPKGLVSKGEAFSNLIFDYARLYDKIFVSRSIVPPENPAYKKYRALIHIMDNHFKASEWRACVLKYAFNFGSDGLFEFCSIIEKVFLEHWVQGIRKDERYSTYANILGVLDNEKNAEQARSNIYIDTEPIVEATQNNNLYGAGYCKYFLLRLELSTAELDSIRELDANSIEHVLPQNPDSTGYWAKNHKIEDIDSYVNTIGNLVLLSRGKNSSASNLDFDKKKDKYLKNRVSDYPRSIQVLGYEDWLRSTIQDRTEEAKSLIIRSL
jgi:hypothetical protein